jgi:hypothetical protein
MRPRASIGNGRDGSLDRILVALAERGPLSYQALPPQERAWRGRYLLMAVAMGASPAFGWANALFDDPDGNLDVQALVAATPDTRIADEL